MTSSARAGSGRGVCVKPHPPPLLIPFHCHLAQVLEERIGPVRSRGRKGSFLPHPLPTDPRGPRPSGLGSPYTGYQPSKLFSSFSMAASSDGVASREPLLPAGGGGVDRGAPSTNRNLHGELAAAAREGAMTTDSPIPPQGGSAEDRLRAALRHIGHHLPSADPVGTPGFGSTGALHEAAHGATSMPLLPPHFSGPSTMSDDGPSFQDSPGFQNSGEPW